MKSHKQAPSNQGDVFLAPLVGQLVECLSVEDAVAVKNAHRVLTDSDDRSLSSLQLGRLAAVLKRYGRNAEAEELRRRASRLRAEQILKKAVGYESP